MSDDCAKRVSLRVSLFESHSFIDNFFFSEVIDDNDSEGDEGDAANRRGAEDDIGHDQMDDDVVDDYDYQDEVNGSQAIDDNRLDPLSNSNLFNEMAAAASTGKHRLVHKIVAPSTRKIRIVSAKREERVNKEMESNRMPLPKPRKLTPIVSMADRRASLTLHNFLNRNPPPHITSTIAPYAWNMARNPPPGLRPPSPTPPRPPIPAVFQPHPPRQNHHSVPSDSNGERAGTGANNNSNNSHDSFDDD